MRVIATAGHIDHGKSALVAALTGIDPDRLPEEKARGMTIDLGFAWLDLDGQAVGVVDVPGHERFIRHMLAGVGGIDLALLVVAADEAVMPQTREHLAILDLLEVRHGVVALTKCDLVDDEWLVLATEETRGALAGTSLRDSPIVPCSSRTGAGLAELRTALATALALAPARPDRGRPHLPIDRVFSLAGHGTVVTGTLLDGAFTVGQEVEIAPGGRRYRIRALQSHQRKLERADPGQRVAINLAGAAVEDLRRGMVVSHPGAIPAATYLDLKLRAAPDAPHGHGGDKTLLVHNQRITLHTGAAERQGTVRLLDCDGLKQGEEGWAQVRLDAPLAALRGDRCVLRIPSPAATVAGAIIVAVNPGRHRRKHAETIKRLELGAAATPAERLLEALATGPADLPALAARADLPAEQAVAALVALAGTGQAVPLARREPPSTGESTPLGGSAGHWTTPAWLDEAAHRVLALLVAYHRRYPLRRGMPSEGAREHLGLERRAWAELLARWRAEAVLGGEGDLICAPEHRVTFTPTHERAAATLITELSRQPYAPGEDGSGIEPELLAALLERGDPVRLAEGVLLTRQAYETMRAAALAMIDNQGTVTVAMLRDRFGTSRKYALALLEHLDDLHLTRRVGDGRVRGPAVRMAGG